MPGINFIKYQYSQDSECKTPIEECTAKGGPSNCRWHKGRASVEQIEFDGIFKTDISDYCKEYLRNNFKPSSEEVAKNVNQVVHQTIKGIQKRFPNVSIPSFYLIFGDNKQEGGGCMSDIDHIFAKETFMCIGKLDQSRSNGYSYAHSDERVYADAARHELGHILTTGRVVAAYKAVINHLALEYGEEELRRKITEWISPYASDAGEFEQIAELFSICTDEDGEKAKHLPDILHEFVNENMLDIYGELAMDEKEDFFEIDVVAEGHGMDPFCVGNPKKGYVWSKAKAKFVSEGEYKKLLEPIKVRISKKDLESVEVWAREKIKR